MLPEVNDIVKRVKATGIKRFDKESPVDTVSISTWSAEADSGTHSPMNLLIVDTNSDIQEGDVCMEARTGYIGRAFLPKNDGTVSDEVYKTLIEIQYYSHYTSAGFIGKADHFKVIASYQPIIVEDMVINDLPSIRLSDVRTWIDAGCPKEASLECLISPNPAEDFKLQPKITDGHVTIIWPLEVMFGGPLPDKLKDSAGAPRANNTAQALQNQAHNRADRTPPNKLYWLPIPAERKSNELEIVLAKDSATNGTLVGRLKKDGNSWYCDSGNRWMHADVYIPMEYLTSLPTKETQS